MATVTILHNAFNTNDKTVLTLPDEDINKPLYNVIPKYIKEYENKNYDVVFSINGVVTEDLNFKLNKNDNLSIVPIPAGGGDSEKTIVRTIAIIALSIYAPQIGSYLATQGGFAATGIAASFFSAGVLVAGGLVINKLIPVQNTATLTDFSRNSPSYSFGQVNNSTVEGNTIPLVLGKAKIIPPVISSHLTLIDDNQYLNVLLAVNDGRFDAIHEVKINDQLIESYTDITSTVRYGTNDQEIIGNFSDNITTVPQNRELNDTTTTVSYTTSGNSVNSLEIGIFLPLGLYNLEGNKEFESNAVEINARYRKVGTTTWNYFNSFEKTVYRYKYTVYGDDTDAINYTFYTDNFQGYNFQGGQFQNREVVGTTIDNDIVIEDIYKDPKRLVYVVENLESGQYELEVRRTTAYNDSFNILNDVTLDYINEVVYDDFSYPNTGLLSINAMATGQLNGGFPTMSAIVENTYVRYFEDNVLTVDKGKRLDNPAWACYQLLKNNGFTDDNIDLFTFGEWATFCTVNFYTCNLVLDQKLELPDALNIVSPLGRGKLIQIGTKWSVVIDKVVSTPTQSFLFTNGNILENTFILDYLPYTDRSNVIEVTYYDEDNDYEASTVQVQSNNFNSTSDEYKTAITYYGCTNQEMAAKYAQFLINNNRYITESVTFNVAIDSLACNVGDVIKVGIKYLTNNLADGRILNVSGNILTLDDEITMVVGKTYSIDIRKSNDDIIYTFDIINTQNTTNTVTLVNPTTTFDKFDVYTIGEQGEQSNLYRVLDINRNSEFERKINAIEYVPEVYNDTTTIPTPEVISILGVNNLVIDEIQVKSEDGSVNDVMSISWQGGKQLEKVVLIDQIEVGRSLTNNFIWDQPIRGKTYTIQIEDVIVQHTYTGKTTRAGDISDLSASETGNMFTLTWNYEEPIDFKNYKIYLNNVQIGVTIEKTFNYSSLGLETKTFSVEPVDIRNVSGNRISFDIAAQAPSVPDTFYIDNILNKEKTLTWTHINIPDDLRGYEIRYSLNNNRDWSKGIKIHDEVILSSPYRAKFAQTQGQYVLMLKSVDTGGNFSDDTKYIVFNQGETITDNVLAEDDLTNFDGTKTNMTINGSVLQVNNLDSLLYTQLDTEVFYYQLNTDEFYTDVYNYGSYEDIITSSYNGLGIIDYTGQGDVGIYWRPVYGDLFYSQLDDMNFYTNNSDLLYGEIDESYNLYLEPFNVVDGNQYQIKIEYNKQKTRGLIEDLKFSVDLPDITETFDDINVSASNTIITSNKMEVIKNVNITLQDDSGTAESVKILSKTNNTATIAAYDSSGVKTTAVVDVIIKGYNT